MTDAVLAGWCADLFGDSLLPALADDVVRAIRNPLGPVRLALDPFSLLDMPVDTSRVSEASYRLAQSLVVCIGGAAVLDDHIQSLAVAPEHDLRAFKVGGGRILIAESFLTAAASDWASERRGYPLDPGGRGEYDEWDKRDAYGLYDRTLHALVFTPRAVPFNHERVTLHELGHGLTVPAAYRIAHLRSDLLAGLPLGIDALLRNYGQDDTREAVCERVLEVLAEAYVWTVLGRWSELPMRLVDALHSILNAGQLTLAPGC